jgi:hypothetical protein
MDSDQISKKPSLSGLLLKLHHENMTGIITAKSGLKSIVIYMRDGHVVYADGIERESKLLKEIAAKKKLDQNQLDELNKIREEEPQSIGQALIKRKLISAQVWKKFLELRVKHNLVAALKMEDTVLGFRKSELPILPINCIDRNIVQLLLETIREINIPGSFQNDIQGDTAVFSPSRHADDLMSNIPLSPSEQKIFAMLDGEKTIGDIMADTGLDKESVGRILFLLACFDLVEIITEESQAGEGVFEYIEIITFYLDLLRIIETYFSKEVGREFENIFDSIKDELPAQSKKLFHDLRLSIDLQNQVVEEIYDAVTRQGKTTEGRLILLTSFNKLIFMLIMRMKKVLGTGLAEQTLNEMMNILQYVEKYKQDDAIMKYVRGNLEDYLKQVKS